MGIPSKGEDNKLNNESLSSLGQRYGFDINDRHAQIKRLEEYKKEFDKYLEKYKYSED